MIIRPTQVYIYISTIHLESKIIRTDYIDNNRKKRQLMDNLPFYCLVFNSEGYHDTAQSLKQSNQITFKAMVQILGQSVVGTPC